MTPPPFYKTYKKTDVFIQEDVPYRNAWLTGRGQTLCQNNRQLIGMSLIGLARQAKNRSQLYFLLKSSLSIWAYGGVKDHIMEL